MRGAEAALRRCQTPPREPGEGAVAPRAVGGAARHRLVAVHLADATSSRRVCCPARAGVVCAVLVLNQDGSWHRGYQIILHRGAGGGRG